MEDGEWEWEGNGTTSFVLVSLGTFGLNISWVLPWVLLSVSKKQNKQQVYKCYLCVSHLSCLLQRWTSRSSGIPSTQYMSDTQEAFNKYSVNEWRCWISNTHSCLKRIVCDSWWHLHIIAWDDRFILSDSPVSPLKAFLASRDSIPPPKKGAREGHSWRRQAQFCLLLPPWYIHSAT